MAKQRRSALGPAARGAGGGVLDELLEDNEAPTTEHRTSPARAQQRRTSPNSRPPAEGTVRTSVDLPEDLHERLKIASIRARTTMRAALLEAVADWLDARGE